jgi:aspartokinase-like uncharacterized kinase
MSPTIVKVGGSLLDWPDLAARLEHWLQTLGAPEVILLAGGGRLADAVRDLDRCHHLGEERAHWLALAALGVTARFLAALVAGGERVESLEDCAASWQRGRRPVLDLERFARDDEGRPGTLPHTWSVTSDSLAARVAQVAGARRLILLKSLTIPAPFNWDEASRLGWVDAHFPAVLRATPSLEVLAVNLRAVQLPRPHHND